MPQFNIRDLPERSAEQIQDLANWTGFPKSQIVLIAVENLWKEVKKQQGEDTMRWTHRKIEKTLEQYMKSEDFRQGVIDSTKASWGGSSYKVEIMPDGTWRNLWSNQIGNKYESQGIIIGLPALDCEDMAEFTESGGSEEEYLSLGFDNERCQIETDLREALRS